MLKALGVLASLAASHQVQASQQLESMTTQQGHQDNTPAAKYDRDTQVQAKKHHPRQRPDQTNKADTETAHTERRSLQDRATCSRAVNRMKNETADFNALLAQGDKDPAFTFTDTSFEFPDSIHWEELPSQEWSLSGEVQNLKWQRILDVFADNFYSMWGNGQIDVEDAIQGQLGDCWLVVAAMSIAENASRIRDIFQVEQKNSVGVYSSKMWLLGMPLSVVIDDYLPLSTDNVQATQYAQVASDGALWGPLFEKSFAKYLGMYEAIDAGGGSHGIEAMTGAPFANWGHPQVLSDPSLKERLWQELLQSSANGAMITCGSYTGTGSDQDVNEVGLPYNHAFSIMRVLEVNDDQQAGVSHKIVELRNPWGIEKYSGDWSDQSDRWTEAIRKQVGHLTDNDGKFYMSFNDYLKYTEYTDISLDVFGWNHSAFAIFGDDEPVDSQTVFNGDPKEYNKHVLQIESPVTQSVSMSVHSYSIKHYHGQCNRNFDAGSEVLFLRPEENTLYQVHPGTLHEPLIEMEAGSTYIMTVYTNFSDNDLMPHDWSLVAWAPEQPVTITHQKGLKSQSFRLLQRDGEIAAPEITGGSSSEPLTYDELMRMGEFSLLKNLPGGLSEAQQQESDELSAKFKIWRQANGLADEDIQTVYDAQILLQVEALSWEQLVEYDQLNQKRWNNNGDLSTEDAELFQYYDNRFYYWMQANGMSDAEPREILDEQLLVAVKPLTASDILEYVQLDRETNQGTASQETTERYELYRLRLETLLEGTSSVLASSIPELLAQLVYDQTQSMTYAELRAFAGINADIKSNPDEFSQETLIVYALVKDRFKEWLQASGYQKVDPEAPGETILAQMTLQTIETQWTDAGTDLLRLKLLSADTDLDVQEQAEFDELSVELQSWIDLNEQASDDSAAMLESLIVEVGAAIGKAPSDEELSLLQDFYYKNWSGITTQTKTEVLTILRALEAHMVYNDQAVKDPIQYIAELLGMETEMEAQEPVTLSMVELLIWQQQSNLLKAKDSGDGDDSTEARTEVDKMNYALLSAKLDAYMSQNGLAGLNMNYAVLELLGLQTVEEQMVLKEDLAVSSLSTFFGASVAAIAVLAM